MSAALKKSPLERVKDEFGGKDKLVDKIVGILDAGDESKDDLRKRLLGVANGKLIRLHSVATRTKAAGGHDKLAASAADKLKHGKDKDYVAKLGEFSNGRLLDMLTAGERAQAAAAAKPARAARAPKPAAEKKAAPAASSPAVAKSAKALKSAAAAKKRKAQ
jgi:pyruvate/2-oxoglutarate dehydrogenase complex dihydrolipoamide acyltransferase (E2) component